MTSTSFRQPLTSALKIDSQERFDLPFLRRLLQAIDVRLAPLQEQQASVDEAVAGLNEVALDRINTTLTPAIEQVLLMNERGFLIAQSATETTLAVGNILTFTIADDTERELFTPSPFTALTREASTDDYAVARTVAYDKVSGDYRCEVLSFVGNAGPHSDWVIGALAGSTAAQYALLEEGQTAREAAVEAAGVAMDNSELSQKWAESSGQPDGADTMSARTASKISVYSALSAKRDMEAAAASADRIDLGKFDADVAKVAESAEQTALDAVATAADRVQTGLNVTAAEAARDSAFVNADVYADIATGRTAVADTEQFMVVDEDEIVRYRRDSASTQTEMARYSNSKNTKNARSIIIGQVTELTYSGSTPTVTLGDVGHYYEEGNSGAVKHTIAPFAATALGVSEGIIVDFDTGAVDGNGRYIPTKANIASGIQTGWQTRNRFILVARGHSNNNALSGEYQLPDIESLNTANEAKEIALASRRKVNGAVTVVRNITPSTKEVYLSEGFVWKEANGGQVEATIAPVSTSTLAAKEGYVIDFDNPILDGNGHHVPEKVLITSGLEGGWQSGNRYILVALDPNGQVFGEYGVNTEKGHYDGEVVFLLNNEDNLPVWDTATRTLTWPDLLFIVQDDSGGSSRIVLEEGSITVPSPDQFYTIALDRREVVPFGNTPASAVKVGDYLGSNGTYLTAANLSWIPLFVVSRGNVTYPVRFPPTLGSSNGPVEVTPGTYEAAEMVVLAGTDEVNIHVKGGNAASNKYLRHQMVHNIVPAKGSDVWRWGQITEMARTGDTSFTTGINLTTGGEQEMAIRFNDKPDTEAGVSDWIGGNAHGDESQFYSRMLIDGVEKPLGVAASFRCHKVEFLQGTNVYEPSTNQAIIAAKSYKYWEFEGNTVELLHNLVWEGEYNLRQTYLTMLSWLRDSNGTAISDTGYRDPLFVPEDISTDQFTPVFTESRIAKASGADGYSAQIEILEGWDKSGRSFQFSNSASYNKFYFMYVPNNYITTAGETFTVRARYQIDTSN